MAKVKFQYTTTSAENVRPKGARKATQVTHPPGRIVDLDELDAERLEKKGVGHDIAKKEAREQADAAVREAAAKLKAGRPPGQDETSALRAEVARLTKLVEDSTAGGDEPRKRPPARPKGS